MIKWVKITICDVVCVYRGSANKKGASDLFLAIKIYVLFKKKEKCIAATFDIKERSSI